MGTPSFAIIIRGWGCLELSAAGVSRQMLLVSYAVKTPCLTRHTSLCSMYRLNELGVELTIILRAEQRRGFLRALSILCKAASSPLSVSLSLLCIPGPSSAITKSQIPRNCPKASPQTIPFPSPRPPPTRSKLNNWFIQLSEVFTAPPPRQRYHSLAVLCWQVTPKHIRGTQVRQERTIVPRLNESGQIVSNDCLIASSYPC